MGGEGRVEKDGEALRSGGGNPCLILGLMRKWYLGSSQLFPHIACSTAFFSPSISFGVSSVLSHLCCFIFFSRFGSISILLQWSTNLHAVW